MKLRSFFKILAGAIVAPKPELPVQAQEFFTCKFAAAYPPCNYIGTIHWINVPNQMYNYDGQKWIPISPNLTVAKK